MRRLSPIAMRIPIHSLTLQVIHGLVPYSRKGSSDLVDIVTLQHDKWMLSARPDRTNGKAGYTVRNNKVWCSSLEA